MATTKIIKFSRYFILLTFLLSTVLISLIYFSPTPDIINVSIVYAAVFSLIALILLLIFGFNIALGKGDRRKHRAMILLLLLNMLIAFTYFRIWDFAMNSILIKIVNNTGKDVKEAGIYGCFEERWGTLPNGESKTVRFPANSSCLYMVSYKMNDSIKLEVLPRKEFRRNVYYLGQNPSQPF